MKVFLSALENGASCTRRAGEKTCKPLAHYIVESGVKMRWNLMSFYYIQDRPSQIELANFIRDNSDEILIDSGAHSFQKGVKVDWEQYTRQYAEFIRKFDRPNVVGYFEMDVDNIIGYDNVLKLRAILEQTSDKIIPVWHKNRGIDEYKKMCEDYAGKVIAITGFKNEDITDKQYAMFVKEARKHGCKVHCLGMTRTQILERVPFDYTDSSSWKMHAIFGKIGNKQVKKQFSKEHREDVLLASYREAMKMQNHFYEKWRKVCGD